MTPLIAAVTDNPVFIAGIAGFAVGLAGGLGVALRGWVGARAKRRELEKEIADLRAHINRHMQITGEGSRALQEELESLRKQNENLRITVKTLENKPGRAEIRTLHVYDRAVRQMMAEAPGFAPAWERAMQEAEEQVAEAESGLSALVRKVFRPVLPSSGGERNRLFGGKDGEES